MIITQTQEGKALTLRLEGRLDALTAPELQKELIPLFEAHSEIVLDFAELTYVSSAGLRVLLMGQKAATSKKAVFTLVNVLPQVMEVFKMTGFSGILNTR
ncbi:MAG: STAS domain-containing protein [Candidatus Adiutrix sp.]|jgi:anti-anti-sigma factor|nr:STAS domain-containing protein [Candidatus Adiutrix sp.]